MLFIVLHVMNWQVVEFILGEQMLKMHVVILGNELVSKLDVFMYV